MHFSKEVHLETVYKIHWYLKAFPSRGFYFKTNETNYIEVFIDVDWGGLVEDKRFNTGYCTFVFRNLGFWKSKKPNVVAKSNTKVELDFVTKKTLE